MMPFAQNVPQNRERKKIADITICKKSKKSSAPVRKKHTIARGENYGIVKEGTKISKRFCKRLIKIHITFCTKYRGQ
jgi:hypothetical protein